MDSSDLKGKTDEDPYLFPGLISRSSTVWRLIKPELELQSSTEKKQDFTNNNSPELNQSLDDHQNTIVDLYHLKEDSTGSCLTPCKNQQSPLKFRSALEFQATDTVNSHPPANILFEDKLAIVTDNKIGRDSKEFFFSHDESDEGGDLEKTIRDIVKQSEPLSQIRVRSRSNSMDEMVNRYYRPEEEEPEKTLKEQDERTTVDLILRSYSKQLRANRATNQGFEIIDLEYEKDKYDGLYDQEDVRCDTSAVETVFRVASDKFKVRKPGIFAKIFRKPENKTMLIMIFITVLTLIGQSVMTSFPVFTCTESSGLCVPQMTIQLVDQSTAAKAALLTVREALKVLSYLAIDFGDGSKNFDFLTNSLDSYYQSKVIDTFNVNTIYKLNFSGYCRISALDSHLFCMKSFGFDLIQVFVRDAGVQLGELTNTNIDIMGNSFAIAYELVITGFNELSSNASNEDGTLDYVKYAILLQKFSKGLRFMSVISFITSIILLALVLILFALYLARNKLVSYQATIGHLKKWIFILINILGFLNIVIGFLICSLTLEFFFKINEIGSSVGIAIVTSGTGFIILWISFFFQFITFGLCVYLTNEYRKGIL